MKWWIPAKTFLLGEYAALKGESAVVITTSPCFSVEKTTQTCLDGIHPHSPAGQYWQKKSQGQYGLRWYDPFHGIGGMGASSAQFIGAWLAQNSAHGNINIQDLVSEYWNFSWNKQGLKPSGYDILAQISNACVYINRNSGLYQSVNWRFAHLHFVLVHTGKKLATHTHLQESSFPENIKELSDYAQQGYIALKTANASALIESVNNTQSCLIKKGLITEHSLELIHTLKNIDGIKAMKGCGAMGADVILLLIDSPELKKILHQLQNRNLTILADNQNLHCHYPLFSNNNKKTLEILTQ